MSKTNDILKLFNIDFYDTVPSIMKFSKKVKLDSSQLVLLTFIILCVLSCFQKIGSFLTVIIMFIFPAYTTFRSLEYGTNVEQKNLLVYWIIYGLLLLFDDYFKPWTSKLSSFHLFRFLLLQIFYQNWFQSSEFIYEKAMKPLFEKYAAKIDSIFVRIGESLKIISEKLSEKD